MLDVAKREIRTLDAPSPVATYSQAIVVPPGLLFIAGQGPFDPRTGQIVATDFREQVRQTLRNLLAIASAAGSGPDHAIKVGVFLADLSDFAALNDVYPEFFSPPYPARTTVACALLGIDVEIDGIFWIPR
jgi:2-iminobutanoate/2-iminopropanoate deaminase